MIPPNKKHNQPPEDLEGELSLYTLRMLPSKCGINALRLYQYIRTVQGLKWPSLNETSHKPVKIDNKKLYEWFGVGPNKKWEAICKLEKKKIIKVQRGGRGRLPTVQIILPKKKLN